MQVIEHIPFGRIAPLRNAQKNTNERISAIADQVHRGFVMSIIGQDLTFQE